MPSSAMFIPAWDDLMFPASAINPTGQAAPPSLNVDNGLWEFSASATNVIALQVQMPHRWKEGTILSPHVHWRKKTQGTGNVMWELKYEFKNLNDDFTDVYTETTLLEDTVSPIASDDGTALKHLLSSWDDIDMTGLTLSCMGILFISRLGGHEDDTYAGVAQLLQFDIHYMIDSLGSHTLYTKNQASY